MSDNNMSNKNTEKFPDAVKNIGIAKALRGLLKSVLGLAIITVVSVYFIIKGMSIFFGIGFIAVMLFVVIIQVVKIVRASAVRISVTESKHDKISIDIDADEVIEEYIAGIQRYGAGTGSYAILGTGKSFSPENAMLITNRNIFLITVPIEGAGVVASDTDISKWQWLTMQKEIENKLHAMLETMTLEELINNCISHIKIPKQDIYKFKTSDISNGITCILSNKKKYSFSVRDKDDYQKVKKMGLKWGQS